jgi:hypothetical protein
MELGDRGKARYFGLRGAHDWFMPGTHYQAPQGTEEYSESGCFARGPGKKDLEGT